MRKNIARNYPELPVDQGELYLGIDFGTTGVRATIVDAAETVVADARRPLPDPTLIAGRPTQDPRLWWSTFEQVIGDLDKSLRDRKLAIRDIDALAIDGTSGTMLLSDSHLNPVTPALMYNSGNFQTEAVDIEKHAPPGSITLGENSGLARLLHLQSLDETNEAHFCMHQADWIAARLMNKGGYSDENNVLKLGYDLEGETWPAWFEQCGVKTKLLPRVHRVGRKMGSAESPTARELGFSSATKVIAGTTDSNAAFLAAGARHNGEGVTSLGTTLAIKLISDRPVQSVDHGIYSHRIGDLWLAGGASNSGGAALLKYFDVRELETLSKAMDPERDTELDYYPLPKTGERFPVNDPDLEPLESPRPKDDRLFLQALLEGIARIEARGYALLQELGAPALSRIYTSGGGAKNAVWTRMRSRICNVPVTEARNVNPAFGSALLAKGNIPSL